MVFKQPKDMLFKQPKDVLFKQPKDMGNGGMWPGALMSYALDSKATDPRRRVEDFNHFVVFDPLNVLACHDFEVGYSCAYSGFVAVAVLPNLSQPELLP